MYLKIANNDKIKKERAGKNYRFKRKNIESNYDNEFSELETKYNQALKEENGGSGVQIGLTSMVSGFYGY